MKNLKKGLLITAICVLVLVFGSISAIYAASSSQTVQAYLGVKILYNGNELTGASQPYIINDTTYVPLRYLMDNFGDKSIYWDPTGYRVLISDKTNDSVTSLQEQIRQKDAEITALKNQIASLNTKIDELENGDDASLSDIEDDLADYFEDAGDDYFNDNGIEVSVSLSGDEDELSYTVKLDFDDADDYTDLTDVDQDDIESFMEDVTSEIEDAVEDTDYESADIIGKVKDNGHSSYYAEYEDGDYTYSWDDDEDETSVSEIEDTLDSYFDDVGDKYFNDEDIVTTISLSGNENDLSYTIRLDFSSANDYDDLTEVDDSDLEELMEDVESKIEDEIDGTNFDGATITGLLRDNDDSSLNVEYYDGSFDYSW
ncbi:MAG: hypothetical protein HPY50_00755 [Firmicutes bacterium]|nr:hypothetical protein [Bacillota bacterium]